MSSDVNNSDGSPKKHWKVDHDKTKCALCVVCARNCETGALRRDEEGGTLSLHYNAVICNGCKGDKKCEVTCPEEAIRILESDAPAEADEHVMLNESELAECEFCHEHFAPLCRLDVVAGRADAKGVKHQVERTFCPLCRRTNLVVDFINNMVGEDSEAKYRSLRAMVRDKKRREDEERAKVESIE
jgi:Fe-S-cluster-containing hydrogenase component 2